MSTESIKILLVEDNPGDVFFVKGMLYSSTFPGRISPPFSLTTVDYLEKAVTAFKREHFDIVLLDLSLPDSHAFDTFPTWKSYQIDSPVIIFTIVDDIKLALQSLQQGAQDYLVKEHLNSESLMRTIRYAIERQRVNRHLAEQTQRLESTNTKLQQKTTQLESLNRDMASFAYSVAHELRHPLTAILGYLNLLQRKYPSLDSQVLKHLETIEMEGNRINQLINDLMQLSGLTQESMEIQQVNLSDIAEMIVEQLRATQPDRLITIHIPPNIKGWGDRLLLWVVLGNLLSNAWKYTSYQATASIEFGLTTIAELAPCERDLLLTVMPEEMAKSNPSLYFIRDNGAGFNMKDVGQLFYPFKRLHSHEEFAGSGLGLTIVERILHRHNATICAIARVNQGATFFFTLPSPVTHTPRSIF